MKVILLHKSLFVRTAGIGVLVTVVSISLLLFYGYNTRQKIEQFERDEARSYLGYLVNSVEHLSQDLANSAGLSISNSLAGGSDLTQAISIAERSIAEKSHLDARLWIVDSESLDSTQFPSFINADAVNTGCRFYEDKGIINCLSSAFIGRSDTFSNSQVFVSIPLEKLMRNLDCDHRFLSIISSASTKSANKQGILLPLGESTLPESGFVEIVRRENLISESDTAGWVTVALAILPILGLLLFGYILYRHFESFARHSDALKRILKREKPGVELFRREHHIAKDEMPELSQLFGLIEENVDEKNHFKRCLDLLGASLAIMQEKGYDEKTLNEMIEIVVGSTGAFGGAVISVNNNDDRIDALGKFNFSEDLINGLCQTAEGVSFFKYPRQRGNLTRHSGFNAEIPEETWHKIFSKYQDVYTLPLNFKGRFDGLLVLLFIESGPQELLPAYLTQALGDLLGAMCYGFEIEREKLERYDKTRILQETSLAISSTLNLSSVLQVVAGRLTDYAGASYCMILLNTEIENTMEVASFHTQRQNAVNAPEATTINIAEFPRIQDSLHSKRTLILGPSDISDFTPSERRFFRTETIRFLTLLPVFHSAKSIGVVILGEERSRLRNTIAPDKYNFLQAIVSQAASAIENARLYGFINQKVDQLTALYNAGGAIHSEINITAMLDKVLQAAHEYLRYSIAGVFLVSENKAGELIPLAVSGSSTEPVDTIIDNGTRHLAQNVVRSGEAMILDDARVEVDFKPTFNKTLSEVAVPIKLGTRVIGVFSIGSENKAAFKELDADFLNALAAQIAVAMERGRLFEQERERGLKLKTIFEFSRKLSRSLNVNEVLRLATESIQEAFGYQVVAIFLMNQDKRQFYVGHQSASSDKTLPSNFIVPFGQGLLAQAVESRKAVYCTNVGADSSYVLAICDVRSEVCIPIIVADRVVGVLDVESMRADDFTSEDISTLEALADIMAVAIDNSYLFEETIQKAERLALIDNINKAISATLDLDSFFKVVAKAVADNAGYRWTALVVPEEDSFIFKAGYTPRSVGMITTESMLELLKDKLRIVIEKATPEYLTFSQMTAIGAPERLQSIVAAGIRHLALFPIGDNIKAEAVMIVGSARTDGFSSQELALLKDLAVHLRIAWQNAQLFRQLKNAYDQLQEAQDRIVQTEKLRALGEMSSGVVHDFNNVLAAILGRIQIISRKLSSFEDWSGRQFLDKNLDIMEKAASDGAQILARISEFTKKKPSEKFVEIRIDHLINDAIELTRPRWHDQALSRGKNIYLDLRRCEELPTTGSPSELREVFTNLFNNAADAIEGEGKIVVDAWLEGDDRIVITVEDTGSGMSPETRKKIFEPFFTTKGARGTGLGLSVTYGIITRHKGQIEVESELGKGTKFIINLPVRKLGQDTTRSIPIVKTEERSASVLVVDDQEEFREVIVEILASGGHQTESAPGPDEALELMREKSFDLVITDLGMQGMSGWELADRIYRDYPNTRIIMATGWGNNLEPENLAAHHVDKLISKPFKIEDILRAVSEVLIAAQNGVLVEQN
jgi:signal transduction histidine kinase/putative methionine-R-sulfoxide reductase with GAF domain/CheY-like chemotaxis protein